MKFVKKIRKLDKTSIITVHVNVHNNLLSASFSDVMKWSKKLRHQSRQKLDLLVAATV